MHPSSNSHATTASFVALKKEKENACQRRPAIVMGPTAKFPAMKPLRTVHRLALLPNQLTVVRVPFLNDSIVSMQQEFVLEMT